MINGSHVIIYSQDADADRAFFRDVLDCRNVDAGAGWLIFKLPPAEVAVHPVEGAPAHELYLMCDDLDASITRCARRCAADPALASVMGAARAPRLPSPEPIRNQEAPRFGRV